MEGCVRPVAGLLAYAIAARGLGYDFVCGPSDDFVGVAGVRQLVLKTVGKLRGGEFEQAMPRIFECGKSSLDFKDVAGHEAAKRALRREIMACS